MENNRLLKKFNTIFWYCLYTLPLIILLLSFIGYFTLYKEKGDLIYSESELIVEEEEVLLGYTSFVPVPNTGYVDNVYFDLNYDIADFEFLFQIFSLDRFVEGLLWCSSGEITLNMMYLDYGFACYVVDSYRNFLYVSEAAVIFIRDTFNIELDFVGWNEILINQSGAYSIDSEVFPTFENSPSGREIGVYNNGLSFFSVEPFESIYNLDKSYYDSVTKEKVLPVSYTGTALTSELYDILYFNYYLSVDELKEICIDLPYDEDGFCMLAESGLGVINNSEFFGFVNLFSMDFYFIYSDIPDVIDMCGSGWINKVVSNISIACGDDYLPIISKFLSPTPFEPVVEFEPFVYPLEFNNGTLFDISLQHTNNTFDDFTLPILENALNNSFNSIGININNNISNFVVMLFAWFIQLMILHIMIDLLIFLPRLFHNYMERWL